MIDRQVKSPARWLRGGLLGLLAVLLLILVGARGTSETVHVYDNAHVLNTNRVQSEASSLPYSVDIYTVNTFTGSKTAFDQETRAKLGNNADLIVIAIDTVHHHMAIVRGANVPLSSSQIQSAISAFASNYGNGDYTAATIACIDSIRNSLGTSSGSAGGIFSGILGVLCIGGLVILGIIIVGAVLLRRSFGGFRRSTPMGMPYQQPYNQPYNQPYPPNYYPPNYNQGPGMNPWAAGGLGAAAGGFLGYELGKEAGEREAGEQGQGQGDGGWAGGSGDFGGGNNGGDFGGGGGDFGGGGSGDSGGGSGDF